MKKFLIVNPFGIGDVLFTTPVARAIKESVHGSFIGYWCNERVEPIIKNNPHVDTTFALSRGDIKKAFAGSKLEGVKKSANLFGRLRSEHFEVAFDFSLDHRYGLVARLSGIKSRIGFNYKNRGRFLTDRIDIDGYDKRHMVEYYSQLLSFIDIQPLDLRLELSVTKEQREKAGGLLNSLGVGSKELVIGIAPGAGESWGMDAMYKHWSAVKFAELSDKLIDNFNSRVMILGDEKEKPISAIIKKSMHNEAIDLTGKTDLEGLAGVISKLGLLVANDGGPLHMAVALGVKTVSLFGPVDDLVYGPYPPSENHIVLKSDLPCRPCYKNFRFTGCSSGQRCLEDISVKEVYSAARRLL